jgi:4-amino-4-deoxy-L-arabinose transferase-like glycosyltransferase
MYLTAGVIKIFGTGYTFLSLKIGAAIAGLLTLPFIYLLGVELGNRRAGILAALLAGIAYWPNVITRVALRFPLYPLFVAPTLFFLIRGLRRSNRNDFILAGLSLGIGLHGYTPFRIMPFVILVAVGLYMLHRQSQGLRKRTLWYLVLLGLIALIAFLPLARFWMENPDLFSYRAFTRLGSIEQPLSGPAWLIFMNNLGRAVTMFAWNNGEIWPVSIPYRPALDVVSAALFYLGIVLLLVRYIRQRNWVDLFLILSVPLLLLPSILSLAFPNENPALNRMAGAIVPVFLIVGLSLDGFLKGLETKFSMPFNTKAAWGIGAILLLWAAVQNFNLVFDEYRTNYELSSWNTSEIGQVIKDYTDSFVAPENAYVVAYPYWVDTRLVGINAGFPTRDFALWPQQFSETLSQSGPKLFVIKPEDQNSIAALRALYPEGYLQLYPSKFENKDFYLFTVLPQVGEESGS